MAITRINNNIVALNAGRHVTETGSKLQKSIERLSSGLRVNRAGDDAAGLTVAARLRSQVNGLNQATANAQDGINVINVAEGALSESIVRLNRIRVLSIQAANTGVNDVAARRALQDEVFQSIDEITRIASTTQFGGNQLLSGDFAVKSTIKAGQSDVGVSLDPSPASSTLEDGLSFLNIRQIEKSSSRIVTGDAPGGPQVLSTAINKQRDMAVSLGFFSSTSSIGSLFASNTSALNASFFNNASIGANFTIAFDGVLADGVTRFNGSYRVSGAQNMTNLGSAINVAISAAEQALFGDTIDTGFDLSAFFTGGRIALAIANGENNFSQASINIRVLNASGSLVTQVDGVTRVNVDSGQLIGFDSTAAAVQTGKIGNDITAITGSTFGSGEFAIHVSDVQAAQQRVVKSTVAFTTTDGGVYSRTASLANAVVNGRFDNGIYTGFSTLTPTTTISLVGTNSDGTTFKNTFSIGAAATDANLFDNTAMTISGLIREMNFRKFSDGTQVKFNGAVATYAADGTIRLIDEIGKNNSQTTFTLVFNLDNGGNDPTLTNGGALTISDEAVLEQEGFAESATIRINGGQTTRANAGDVITAYGEESSVEGVPVPQLTFRIGAGLTAGTDTFITTAAQYVGTLNGGNEVTFQNGDQDISFVSGSTGRGPAQTLTVDFDAILDVTKKSGGNDPGTTIIISTSNEQLNFQVGAFAGQNFRVSLGDLRADALGFGRGSGRTIADIDITTLTGANEALAIVDEALDQVNRTRSLLGAATNRLESTVANLSVTSENLTASESRIMDTDLAKETTEFTLRQVQLQAGVSVLAQSNFQTQAFLALLG